MPTGMMVGGGSSQASTDSSSMNNPLAESLTSDMILRQQLIEQSLQSAKKQQKRLELPKELCFSSDDDDDLDLAGFQLVVASSKQAPVKYLPDHERDSDGAKIGFNFMWHESVKREKNLIIEAPRPKVNTIRALTTNKHYSHTSSQSSTN